MKKLTLLLVSFFAVFALGLTGCSDDPDVKQETPVIKASNPADIAAVAGKVTVPYTVDYAVDGCSRCDVGCDLAARSVGQCR